jgi:capsular polysaccharide transport system ATP-binding protein
MIHLINITKSYHSSVGHRTILRPTTLSIPCNRNVALLGRNGAGKSTLIRLIGGVEEPDSGEIVRTARVSWPLGLRGAVHSSLTGRQNCSLVSRIHGRNFQEIFDYVADFSELGPYLDIEVSKYSSGMRARLAFGLSLAMDFDCYLIDESLGTGDRWFRRKSLLAFEARRQRSGMLFVSHKAEQVRQYCDLGMVLVNGWLVPFDSLEEAIDFYYYGIRKAG